MTNLGRIIPLFKGTYNSGTTYSFLDVVEYNGSSYVAKQQTSGNLPTNTTYWTVVAKAGSWSTFTAAEKAELLAQIETDLNLTYTQGNNTYNDF